MKIGLFSDSHEEIENLRRAFEFLKRENVDWIIHLGDDYSDMDNFFFPRLLRIPGVYDEEYVNRGIKHRMVKNFGKIKALLSHTEISHPNDFREDIRPEEMISKKEVDAIFYGHTHLYRAEVREGVLFVNPGHLKKVDKKGMPPTFSLIEVNERKIDVKILGIDGSVKKSEGFQL